MTHGGDKAARLRGAMPEMATDAARQLENFVGVGRLQSLLGNAAVADAALNAPSSGCSGLPKQSPAQERPFTPGLWEDHAGLVILSNNLKDKVDPAFSGAFPDRHSSPAAGAL